MKRGDLLGDKRPLARRTTKGMRSALHRNCSLIRYREPSG